MQTEVWIHAFVQKRYAENLYPIFMHEVSKCSACCKYRIPMHTPFPHSWQQKPAFKKNKEKKCIFAGMKNNSDTNLFVKEFTQNR